MMSVSTVLVLYSVPILSRSPIASQRYIILVCMSMSNRKNECKSKMAVGPRSNPRCIGQGPCCWNRLRLCLVLCLLLANAKATSFLPSGPESADR